MLMERTETVSKGHAWPRGSMHHIGSFQVITLDSFAPKKGTRKLFDCVSRILMDMSKHLAGLAANILPYI